MPDVATSLHMRNVNELMLLVPLKYGFVEHNDIRVSYATRLRKLLTFLFRSEQDSAEQSLLPTKNFVDVLHNIYHYNYGVVDNLQQSKLVLSATFDSSWEAYFHNLVDKIGEFLDAVFCHCQGFEGRSCEDGYEAFADFIREHQVQIGMLYSAAPELTTDDLRTLRQTRFGKALPEPGVSEETDDDMLHQGQRLWAARYRSKEWQGSAEYRRLRMLDLERFFRGAWDLRKLFPSTERIDAHRSAQDVFDKTARLLAESLADSAIQEDIDEKYIQAAFQNALLTNTADEQEKKEAQAWAEELLKRESPAKRARLIPAYNPETESVQNHIIEESDSNEAMLTLMRFPIRKRRQFLGRLAVALTASKTAELHVNLGFTYPGLRRIGLEPETLELFPKEFQEGMEQRAAALGDFGWPNHPNYWRLRGELGACPLNSVDLVVLFHRKDAGNASELEVDVKEVLHSWLPDGELQACLVHMERLASRETDFFGFKRPPTNQPVPSSSYEPPKEDYSNSIAIGDVVLGHPNHRGQIANAAQATNTASSMLFRNGTFLVVRKLAQNVDAYRKFLHSGQIFGEAASLQKEDVILGKLRETDQPYPKAGAADDANYPRISHRRRSNPRTRAVPRLVRRSFSYSAPSNDNGRSAEQPEVGHMFMCYNASIAEQYEVVQRWINGGNSTGLLSSKVDLLAGQHVPHELAEPGAKAFGNAKPAGDDVTKRVPNVTLRWGLYAFVPSKEAVSALSELISDNADETTPPASDASKQLRKAEQQLQVERGVKLLAQLDAIKDFEIAKLSWKQLFEEFEFARDARAVWAAIRAQGGRKQTAYGLLLASSADAQAVLGDDGTYFSVLEYRKRFRATGFDFYLGMDRTQCPHSASAPGLTRQYQTAAQANRILRNRLLTPDLMFDCAFKHARSFLNAQLNNEQANGRFDLRDLARQVVGKVAAELIGIPNDIATDDVKLRKFLDNFAHITRYSSFPHPEPWIAQQAMTAGEAMRNAYDASPVIKTGLASDLATDKYGDGDSTAIRDAMIIANIGFVPPALSMLITMLTKWLSNGDIAQAWLRDRKSAHAAVIRELGENPTFTVMYRTALEGNTLALPGTLVVVGMQSAIADAAEGGSSEPERWQFGGDYASPEATLVAPMTAHACPLRSGALDVLTGAVTAVAIHVYEQSLKDRVLTGEGEVTFRFETVARVLPGYDVPKPGPRITTP